MKFFGTIFDLFDPSDDHSVIINFNYYQEELDDLHHLADRLRTHLNGSDIGEYDGHETEVGGSDANLYLYGQNAEPSSWLSSQYSIRQVLCVVLKPHSDSVLSAGMRRKLLSHCNDQKEHLADLIHK